MKVLAVFDEKNYTDDMPKFERYCVRGVIVRDGKIAMQKGSSGEYKILGGGMEPDEDVVLSLAREVQEESGLVIKPETIREAGEIFEAREDLFEKGTKYICHSLFYFCDAEDELRETHMTESELEKGYHLEWATCEEIIEGNQPFMHQPWIRRDTEFIQMLAEGRICQ